MMETPAAFAAAVAPEVDRCRLAVGFHLKDEEVTNSSSHLCAHDMIGSVGFAAKDLTPGPRTVIATALGSLWTPERGPRQGRFGV